MICRCCKREPKNILEYKVFVWEGEYATEEDAVIGEEGTYDEETSTFLCTDCYVQLYKKGMVR